MSNQSADVAKKLKVSMRNALGTDKKKLNTPCKKMLDLLRKCSVRSILGTAAAAALMKQNKSCLVWKRVQVILNRFDKLSASLGVNDTYPEDMSQFVENFEGYDLTMLQNDTEHIMQHRRMGSSCRWGDGCIHRSRALRDRQSDLCKDVMLKKQLFRTKSEDVAEFVAISMLDRLVKLLVVLLIYEVIGTTGPARNVLSIRPFDGARRSPTDYRALRLPPS